MILHKPSDTGHCVHLQMKKQKFKEVIRLNQVPTVNGVIQIYGLVSKMLLFSTHLVVFLINSLAKGLPQSKPRCCPAPNFLPLEPAWQIWNPLDPYYSNCGLRLHNIGIPWGASIWGVQNLRPHTTESEPGILTRSQVIHRDTEVWGTLDTQPFR